MVSLPMTQCIVVIEPMSISPDKLDVVLNHLREALDTYKQTGFVTRVVLTGWRFGNGKPIYAPLKEETWIEGWERKHEYENSR